MQGSSSRQCPELTQLPTDRATRLCHRRKGLRRMGVTDGVVAVWSDEPVQRSALQLTDQKYKQSFYGTMSYVPAWVRGLGLRA